MDSPPLTKIETRSFRLVPYQEYDAVTNMAVDEALLDLHLQGKTQPTLRFYGWSPPAVSFGYAQKVLPETIERIKAAGYDVVRRPTGGRAVLHEEELTYCFIASDDILEPSVAKAYRQICQALINGLTDLGVETSLGKTADGSYKSYEDCFQATTQADLQYQGKKIVGSAQLRRRNGVMQHGSIMLNQKQDRMAELLSYKEKIEQQVSEIRDSKRHFNLRDLLASNVDRSSIEDAISRGFTRAFDCRFTICDIKDEEWALIETMKAESGRYGY